MSLASAVSDAFAPYKEVRTIRNRVQHDSLYRLSKVGKVSNLTKVTNVYSFPTRRTVI